MKTRTILADDHGITAAVAALRAGGVIAIPTDTVYGIAVGLDTPGGIERMFAAKRRPPEKAIAVLVDGLDQVEALVDLPPAARVLATAGWPGGLTLVLPLSADSSAPLPVALTAGSGSLGVRVPDHRVPRLIARAVGPLPTTSANLSGAPDALDAPSVARAIGDEVDLILDGGRVPGQLSSTVIDLTKPRPVVIRVGAIPLERLAEALDAAGLDHDLRA